jgi:hypothetical protein
MSKQDFLDTRVGKGSIRGSAYQSDMFSQSVMNFAYSSILPPESTKGRFHYNDNRNKQNRQLNGGRLSAVTDREWKSSTTAATK